MVQINWEDCEPTEENFWKNVETLDLVNHLKSMVLVTGFWYKLHPEHTPADLEQAFRKRNLNVGLMAVDPMTDSSYREAIESERGYLARYPRSGTPDPDAPRAKYAVFTSCRPRELVIKETLTHSRTLEENLEKLRDAGDLVIRDQDDVPTAEKFPESQMPLNKAISEGLKKAVAKVVDLREVLQRDLQECPDAQPVLYAMDPHGTPVFIYVHDGKLASRVAFSIGYDENGNKVTRLITVSSLGL